MSRGKKYTHASFAIRATFSTIDHNCPTISLACPRCNHHKAAALELFAAMDNWPTSQPFWRSAILHFDMSDRSLLDIELITLELQRTLQTPSTGADASAKLVVEGAPISIFSRSISCPNSEQIAVA
jgi:hypothetical protein